MPERSRVAADADSLATAPPRPRDWIAALVFVAVLALAFAITLQYASVPLARLDSFIPTVGAVVFVADLATAVLLFDQFSMRAQRALLLLASGYFFSALMGVPFVLSFPGAFAPAGLFGGAPAAVWTYVFWHAVFAASVLGYALLKDRGAQREIVPRPNLAIAVSLGLGACLVFAATWVAAGADLPRLLPDAMDGGTGSMRAARIGAVLTALALLTLWLRRKCILDLWLMVVMVAATIEAVLIAVVPVSPFSVGFYASRAYSVVTSTVVLGVLLFETGLLHRRVARTAAQLQHERDNKLMSIEAVMASVVHEVRQPLAAIASNADAALLYLERPTPDLDEAREAMKAIVEDSLDISEVLRSIRALFQKADRKHRNADVNATVLHALRITHFDIAQGGVTALTRLNARLPQVACHDTHLLQVLLNIIQNALEAMSDADARPRLLRVRTEPRGGHSVAIAIEDTGRGIDPDKLDTIFDPFVTTKPHGMGLGLAICRTIVEQNGGHISVTSAAEGGGAVFEVVLPIAGEASGRTSDQAVRPA